MSPAFAILFLLLFLFSVYLGFTLGNWKGERTETARGYWALNLLGIFVAALLVAVLTLLPLLAAVPLGLLGGWIAGLKMGFGESSGPWRVFDRFLNVNRGHRDTASSGAGRERRHRKRVGDSGPDMISVADGSRTARDATKKNTSKKG